MLRHMPCALAFAVIFSTAGMAAEVVAISGKLKWSCEGDTQVHINETTGTLRIISKSAKIDQTLPFYSCHSSHCDWGPTVAAAECQEAPCAEIIAGPKGSELDD